MAGETADAAASAEEIADTLTVSASTFGRVLSQGLRNAVSEGYTLERVLQRAALSVSGASLRDALRPITSAIGGGLNTLSAGFANGLVGLFGGATAKALPFAKGGVPGALGAATAGVRVTPFADGGVIGSPTLFGAGGGRVGLMGEAGREAVLPLARGPDGRLGVGLEGGGGGTTVNVTINTPDVAGFQRSEAQVTAMLARAVARGRRGL